MKREAAIKEGRSVRTEGTNSWMMAELVMPIRLFQSSIRWWKSATGSGYSSTRLRTARRSHCDVVEDLLASVRVPQVLPRVGEHVVA